MNLLGGTFSDLFAFDLFGGSGILGFEAVSRGAQHAVIWEILKPRAADILRFSKELGISDQVTVIGGDILRWTEQGGLTSPAWERYLQTPWILFACPPYRMWDSQGESLRSTLSAWLAAAPPGTLAAVELELETDLQWLPQELTWDIRAYAPAKIAIAQTSSSSSSNPSPPT